MQEKISIHFKKGASYVQSFSSTSPAAFQICPALVRHFIGQLVDRAAFAHPSGARKSESSFSGCPIQSA